MSLWHTSGFNAQTESIIGALMPERHSYRIEMPIYGIRKNLYAQKGSTYYRRSGELPLELCLYGTRVAVMHRQNLL